MLIAICIHTIFEILQLISSSLSVMLLFLGSFIYDDVPSKLEQWSNMLMILNTHTRIQLSGLTRCIPISLKCGNSIGSCIINLTCESSYIHFVTMIKSWLNQRYIDYIVLKSLAEFKKTQCTSLQTHMFWSLCWNDDQRSPLVYWDCLGPVIAKLEIIGHRSWLLTINLHWPPTLAPSFVQHTHHTHPLLMTMRSAWQLKLPGRTPESGLGIWERKKNTIVLCVVCFCMYGMGFM